MAHEQYKQIPDAELWEMLGPSLKQLPTRPRHHQLVSLCWALDKNRRRTMLWHDIGTGKSLIGLYQAHLWGARRILICCPKSVAMSWREQIETHAPHMSYLDLSDGDGAWRREMLRRDQSCIQIVNYDGLLVLFGKRQAVKNKELEGRSTKVIVDPELSSPYDMVICDESHSVCSPNAVSARIAAAISEQATSAILMTGTPITTDEQSLWMQYFILDQGQTLGNNFFGFRNTYFRKGGFKWFISKTKREAILNRIAPRTLRYAVEECVDLPELIQQERTVELIGRQREEYDRLLAAVRGEFRDRAPREDEMGNVANRLYQICSGFLLQDGEAVDLCGGKNPKLAELREILNATAKVGRKILVCHNYVHEGRMIEELCRKMDLRFSSFRGEISAADKREGYDRFKNGNVDVLIFNARSFSEGLNLQVAKHICFFSLSYLGTVRRMQSIGRIHRAGQTERCCVIDLLARGTIETEISRKLSDRIEIVKAIMDYIRG